VHSSAERPAVHIPHATEGRNFLVTGGNAGIGYFVAEQLAGTGATVVVFGTRDTAKTEAAMASIRSRVPGAHVRHLTSLKTSVDALELDSLDAIVYNAGVLLDQSQRRETKDGNELTFGTNHLGHFALTHWLLTGRAPKPRRHHRQLHRKVRAAGPRRPPDHPRLPAGRQFRPDRGRTELQSRVRDARRGYTYKVCHEHGKELDVGRVFLK
jgi:NAD(P)-dependent dehydrogenase (short-subunit alcohol dehydrogenase family)